MLKIVTILGARPQFVKASVVSRVFSQEASINEIIVHTGQHYDRNMSEIFFTEMEISHPNYNLGIRAGHHGEMTGRMLEAIEGVILLEKPDYVLVYGDTNSTLAGALAAKKQNVKVIHVEAGLRSFNNTMPEEINRILTDRISDILFYPTVAARENLEREGFPFKETTMISSGDVMYDAALLYSQKANLVSTILEERSLSQDNFVLCTLHRQENTDSKERLTSIVKALNQINQKIEVVLPLHPRTQKKLTEFELELNVKAIEPVSYFDMLQLLKECRFVITDSGGLQKEAYFFSKYCLTLRDETEWIELVKKGYNRICGATELNILKGATELMGNKPAFEQGIYGNGDAAKIIKNTILELYEDSLNQD